MFNLNVTKMSKVSIQDVDSYSKQKLRSIVKTMILNEQEASQAPQKDFISKESFQAVVKALYEVQAELEQAELEVLELGRELEALEANLPEQEKEDE
jgi:hypothetical protein